MLLKYHYSKTEINILQSMTANSLPYGGMFNYRFIANVLLRLTVKELRK